MNEIAVIDQTRLDLGGNIRHGDPFTFCPRVWTYLIDRFAVRSVLDVGCGEGHAVAWFNRNLVYAVGIDGLPLNVHRAVHPIVQHDITEFPFKMPVDLVWSCEVAEHIDPAYVECYVDTLCNGKVIAMTHAIPGQGGHHHVNEQPTEYWVEMLQGRGYRVLPMLERNLVEDWYTYFQSTGLVFVRT